MCLEVRQFGEMYALLNYENQGHCLEDEEQQICNRLSAKTSSNNHLSTFKIEYFPGFPPMIVLDKFNPDTVFILFVSESTQIS